MLKNKLLASAAISFMALVLYASRQVKAPQEPAAPEARGTPAHEAASNPQHGPAVLSEPPSMERLALERELRIADLREYAEKGLFPHNHGHEGKREPYFMDRHGRLCAVGYLIAKSQAGPAWSYERFMGEFNVARSQESVGVVSPRPPQGLKLVPLRKILGFFTQIAAVNNHLRIADVRKGPILDWILRSGLTQEEAAYIQPGYSYLACNACLPGSENGRGVTFGQPTAENQRIEAEDRERIRKHLAEVAIALQRNTAESLAVAFQRARGGPLLTQPKLRDPG